MKFVSMVVFFRWAMVEPRENGY